MQEKNSNLNSSSGTAAGRIRRKNMLKRQRNAIILMITAIVLLTIAFFAALYFIDIYVYEDVDGSEYYIKKIDGAYSLCYKGGDVCDKNSEGYYQTDIGTLVKVDPKSGQWKRYAVVDTSGTEVVGFGEYVLMFKELTYDMASTDDMSKVIKQIEVHNEFGGYSFVRGEGNNFFIKGYESAPYNKELFAQLAKACGAALSMRRLEDPKRLPSGEIDFAEYGLTEKTIAVEKQNGDSVTTEEAVSQPSYYIITTMTGESHKVIIGDLTVTGTGYYARYEGRDTIYVLGSQGIGDTVLRRVEELVTPMIVYPMGMTDYFNVANFTIYDNIDYDAIAKELSEKYSGMDEEEIDDEQFSLDYSEAFEKNSHKACDFSYVDADSRKNTMYSAIPYVSELEYTDGYYINGSNIDMVLYSMYETEFIAVEKLAPDEEDFEKYGLDYAPYAIGFLYLTKNEGGEDAYVYNFVEISEKTEEGIYYAYSATYDMIVSVSESSFDFLSWEEIDWYDTSYIQLDIGHVEDVVIESPDFSVHFEVDDSASRYMTYFAQSGNKFTEGKKTYSIKKDALSGKYVLACDGKTLDAVYAGDYLITPLAYVAGTAQSDKFLFVEEKPFDIDGDGNEDCYAYYYYNVVFTGTEYSLAARIVLVDSEGNKLGEERSMLVNSSYTTDFFITNSSYLYIINKRSYIGQELDKKYGSVNRGRWGSGNIFVTVGNKNVIVNSKTGEWSILDDISCGFYAADDTKSRLAQRAVEIPAKYNSAGKVTRHSEIFYPTTEQKLQYDEETGAIQTYNYKQKVWEKVSYSDCTIGVWSEGAYYLTEGGQLIAVNGETGDWGVLEIASEELYIADIIANGSLLDYNIKTTNHAGVVTVSNATDNFKQFYKGLLYASLEGMAELDDSQKESLASLDDFSEGGVDNPCQLKITVYAMDLYGNRRDVVYRFYQYSERKSFITIEALESPKSESESSEAYGSFYVLRSFADKIIEDAKKMVNEEEVVSITKY